MSFRFRHRFSIALLSSAAAVSAFACASTQKRDGADKVYAVAWPVDNTREIGGYRVETVGEPKVESGARAARSASAVKTRWSCPVNPLDMQYDFTVPGPDQADSGRRRGPAVLASPGRRRRPRAARAPQRRRELAAPHLRALGQGADGRGDGGGHPRRRQVVLGRAHVRPGIEHAASLRERLRRRARHVRAALR